MTSALLVSLALPLIAAEPDSLEFDDPNPQRYTFKIRASDLDDRVAAHPEIGFLIEQDGKPADEQVATVDTRVKPRGKLVIWLMAPKEELFERLNSYGLHAIQPHYARHWFGKICRENPVGEHCRGNARLEATTGLDKSDDMDLTIADGMAERARRLVLELVRRNPQAGWDHFLDADEQLRWDDVIVSGASHGATSAARFAKHQKVSRVVCFCGPRDQFQSWQALPSATPANRIFGFSHTLDMGWEEDHYCRSWTLMGLHEFGPVVDVDATLTPYKNSRRLITRFDVGGDAKRAHSSVTPGRAAAKDPADGDAYTHEAVWRYLFTHPVDAVGTPVAPDANCNLDQRGNGEAHAPSGR